MQRSKFSLFAQNSRIRKSERFFSVLFWKESYTAVDRNRHRCKGPGIGVGIGKGGKGKGGLGKEERTDQGIGKGEPKGEGELGKGGPEGKEELGTGDKKKAARG